MWVGGKSFRFLIFRWDIWRCAPTKIEKLTVGKSVTWGCLNQPNGKLGTYRVAIAAQNA